MAAGTVRLLTNTNLPAPWNLCLNADNPSPLAAQLLQAQPKLAEVAINWNQQGPPGANGANGLSVQPAPVPVGDPTCPNGGSKFTIGTATTYACNGKDGTNGINGKDGANGKDGTSVTSVALAPGDPNCPNGGSAFTSASGTTYACNGATAQTAPTARMEPTGRTGLMAKTEPA